MSNLPDAKVSPERLDYLIDWYAVQLGHVEVGNALRELKALRAVIDTPQSQPESAAAAPESGRRRP